MDIIRASSCSFDLFDESKLKHGACCFYTEDRTAKFYFEIVNHTEAIVHCNDDTYLYDAIDEFCFYSGFVNVFRRADGDLIKMLPEVCFQKVPIIQIQPSQFYVNKKKLEDCKLWIKSESDVRIPVARTNGEIISLDGHTRMRAAKDLGFSHVFVYDEETSDYIFDFADMAKKRLVKSINDMPIISETDYTEKWHKFCDEYFQKQQ